MQGSAVRVRVLPWLVVAFGLVAAGCEEGRAPYPVIDPAGSSTDFLPADGVQPGTVRTDYLIYKFDRTRYRIFEPLPGTDPRYIFRDSVLALSAAGNPGAPLDLRLRPDLSDPTLAAMYADPRLFGYEPAPPAEVGFVEGRRTTSAAEFIPTQTGNRWDYNHNGREWALVDSIVGPSSAVTAPNMPVVRSLATASARGDLDGMYLPPVYDYTTDFTAAPGIGLYLHAWQLIAERTVPRNLRPPGSLVDRQRNPRTLWLPVQQSSDPTGQTQTSLDHCVDELPSFLELVPLKLTDDEIREGTVYTTWTYLTIDDQVLQDRLDSEAMAPRGGRCGLEFVLNGDTLRMFPTRTYRLLCQFEVSVQRIARQYTIQSGATVLGRYPRTPADNAVVNLRITMSTSINDNIAPVELVDMWLQRGIGQVAHENGVFADARSRARLRSAVVNGVVYPPNASNPAFEYFDE